MCQTAMIVNLWRVVLTLPTMPCPANDRSLDIHAGSKSSYQFPSNKYVSLQQDVHCHLRPFVDESEAIYRDAPDHLVVFLARQLAVPVETFATYGARSQTITDHSREIMAALGMRPSQESDLR
jgi:Domain of unknown function (DUF4158)